jgi:hypothetical protein
MTSKEKAVQLFNKYRTYIRKADVYDCLFFEDENFLSKQCALIAVDEILEVTGGHINHFYQQVKTEIEKL